MSEQARDILWDERAAMIARRELLKQEVRDLTADISSHTRLIKAIDKAEAASNARAWSRTGSTEIHGGR
jgi:hypothetical protein